MRFRLQSLSACLIGASLFVVACGGSSSTNKTDDAPRTPGTVQCPISALPKSGPKVKVSFWYGSAQGKIKEVLMKLTKSYNASQDRVEVTASDQGQDYATMLNKYTAAMQGDRIPNVIFADASQARFLADSGTIIPGGSCAKEGVVPLDDIIPVVRNYYTLDGVYIPGAVNVSSTMSYYNRLSFQAAGLEDASPGTLADLRDVAEKLKAAKLPDMKWPVSLVPSPRLFNAWVTGIGGTIVDEDNGHAGHATKALFDTPQVAKMLGEIQSMYTDGLIAKISGVPGQIDQFLNVAQGRSAIVIDSSGAATTIEAFLGGGLSPQDLEEGNLGAVSGSAKMVPGFGPFPGVTDPGRIPVIGAAYYVTNGGSKAQQAAAMDFIRYVNQTPQQLEWLTQGSYLSGNSTVAKTPDARKFFDGSVSGMVLEAAAEQVAKVPADQPGPILGPFDQYDKIIRSMLESVFFKGADPATSLAKAQKDVTAALKSYNTENGF